MLQAIEDVSVSVQQTANRDGGALSRNELLIELEDVSKVLTGTGHSTQILQSLNLGVQRGEFIAIMGPSGSGKTTLLNLVGGLDRPTSGKVRVLGVALDRLGRNQLAQWRARHVGYVFQFYNLIPVLSARHNVELALSLQGIGAAERRRRSDGALQLVGLSHRVDHRPQQLSGGEQQRVAIARAIVGGPSLLLCDEPTGDLDRETGTQIMELLRMLNTEFNKTVIMVTHDPVVAQYADRIVRLDKGRVRASEANTLDVRARA